MTSPKIRDLKDRYLGLPDSNKMIFPALVSGHLTIHGRGFGLDLIGEEQIRAYMGLNELQHLISFHVAGNGTKQDRYLDDVFVQVLFEKASSFGLSEHLAQSLHAVANGPQGGLQFRWRPCQNRSESS
jgi:hypothetical protein